MFNPERLSLARRRRGLTKKALAEALGVDPRTIARYEAGETAPPDGMISRLATILRFPETFFGGSDIGLPDDRSASFRSLSSMLARERDAALMSAALAFLLDDWVDRHFTRPILEVPDLGHEEPEAAARSLRQMWAIGERPVRNMIHLLEAKGVRVFSLAERTDRVDAFSLWRNESAYVFLNTVKSAERTRFDAAHELGHLVLHRHGGPEGREAEDQVNRFAATFLMPDADVTAVLPRTVSLDQILRGKKRWGVSVAALNRRLHTLGLITGWQYQTFCIQISERGYRTNEPFSIPRERSVVWQKVFDALRKEKVTKAQLAARLDIPSEEIEKLVFGLATMLTIQGGHSGREKRRSRARLKVVDA